VPLRSSRDPNQDHRLHEVWACQVWLLPYNQDTGPVKDTQFVSITDFASVSAGDCPTEVLYELGDMGRRISGSFLLT
jgi:hypothetical protein